MSLFKRRATQLGVVTGAIIAALIVVSVVVSFFTPHSVGDAVIFALELSALLAIFGIGHMLVVIACIAIGALWQAVGEHFDERGRK